MLQETLAKIQVIEDDPKITKSAEIVAIAIPILMLLKPLAKLFGVKVYNGLTGLITLLKAAQKTKLLDLSK